MEEEFKKIDSENKWDQYFLSLSSKSRLHSTETGQKNESLNRYLDVIPYDRSIVKLQRCPDTDYINANLVTVPKAARQYILTQGPIPATLSHFWLMVWEQKSNVIVMLNRCVEVDTLKCEQYWPHAVDDEITYDDVGLTIRLTKVETKKHFTVRHLLLSDLTDLNRSRTVQQFQYTAWPDYDQPDSPTSFLRLLSAIRKSGGLDKMDEPSIVHCSAGIGRSGTFCLIDSVLSMIENQGSFEGIDIANTLLEMRDYRKGLIQSPVQLRFAYMSILCGIKILEKANKLHPHMSSIAKIKMNGSNGTNNRRNKKRQTNGVTPNVFNKHQLVEALDNIDSDSADSLFEESMKHLPSLKKARNTAPHENYMNQLYQFVEENQNDKHLDITQQMSAEQKAQLLSNAINSLLAEREDVPTDSVLLRRRERDARNQRLAQKTMEIKNRMKEEELKKERSAQRMAFYKKSALVGGFAVLVSSLVYIFGYLHV